MRHQSNNVNIYFRKYCFDLTMINGIMKIF